MIALYLVSDVLGKLTPPSFSIYNVQDQCETSVEGPVEYPGALMYSH